MKRFLIVSTSMVHRTMQQGGFILGCLIFVLLLISSSSAEKEISLKDTAEISTLRKLVRTLIAAEKVGLRQSSDAEKKGYKKVTLRLQEYINEIVLSAGDDARLYPKAIAHVIAEEIAKKQLTKRQLAEKLEKMYQKDEFEKIAEKIKKGEIEDPSKADE